MPVYLDAEPLRDRIVLVVAPMAEALNSLHVLAEPSHHPSNQAWTAATRAALAPDLLAALDTFGRAFNQWLDVGDLVGRIAPFDAPPEVFFAALAEASPETVARVALGEAFAPDALVGVAGLDALGASAPGAADDPASVAARRAARADPAAFVAALITLLRRYWDDAFAAEWARRRPLLEQRRAQEAARLDSMPPTRWLTGLHDRITYDAGDDAVVFHKAHDVRLTLGAAQRIICVPSTFSAPHLMVGFQPEATGTVCVIYINVTQVTPAPERAPAELLAIASALADATRLRIFKLTLQRPRYTQEIAALLGLAEPTVSRHLKLLKAAGLVQSRKEGPVVLYTGALDAVDRLPALMREFLRG